MGGMGVYKNISVLIVDCQRPLSYLSRPLGRLR